MFKGFSGKEYVKQKDHFVTEVIYENMYAICHFLRLEFTGEKMAYLSPLVQRHFLDDGAKIVCYLMQGI